MITEANWNEQTKCYEMGSHDDVIISHNGSDWVFADTKQPAVAYDKEWSDQLTIKLLGGPRDGETGSCVVQ